jgi:hypothetical protein
MVQVVGNPNANAADTTGVGGSNYIWLLKDKPGERAHLSFELVVLGACIRSAKQDDTYGASNIILPCPGS